MATFPALIPNTRTFTAANYPGAAHRSYSGREGRVRTSNAQTGARFRFRFAGLTEAQMLAIRDHYYGQLGRFVPFQLSTELLSGMADPTAVTPTGYQWIYVGSPKVTDLPAGTAEDRSCLHDVELELEMVPEVAALVSGANWVARAAIAGGEGDGGILDGASWSAAATITGGDAIFDSASDGASWSAAAAISGGTAEGILDASVSGAAWSAAAAVAGGGILDANFSSVSLLLHMDGSNGSTAFTDNSSSPKTITANGNAQISTAQSKFGGAAGLFDGTTDYITAPASSSFALFAGDFTVEFWVNVAGTTSNQCCIQLSTSGTERANITIVSGLVALYTETGGGNATRISGTAPSANTWAHVAWVRSGSTSALYLNGTSLGTASSAPYPSGNMLVEIGANSRASGATCVNGYIDDLRITKGIARYTTTFTPPTAAFPDS